MRESMELYDCDRCKFQFTRSQLKMQKGLMVCPDCYDDTSKIKNVNMKLVLSPRTNSDTTTAVTNPTVFTITAAGGVTPSHSQVSEETRSVTLEPIDAAYFGSSYYMKIVGDGAVNITANPQIVVGQHTDLLTLHGTSDTNTVLLENGDGVELYNTTSFTIGENDVISLVYDENKTKWVEVSRKENGGF